MVDVSTADREASVPQFQSACVVCGATTDAFLCGNDRTGSGCLGLLMQRLGDCAWLADELNTTLARQDKMGGASVGFVSNGGDEQPLPINLKATEAGAHLRDRLCSWARDLWESNAPRDEDGSTPILDLSPTIVSVSRWLMRHPTWISLHPAADELFAEISEDIKQARRAIDSAPGKVYIGTCSAPLDDPKRVEYVVLGDPVPRCDEELYVYEDQLEKRCPTCSTDHDVPRRRRVLGAAVEHQYVPVGFLVGLVTDRGHRLTTSMLRNLKARGRITAYISVQDKDKDAEEWRTDAYGFRVRPRKDEDAGRESLYLVKQVLEAITTKRYQREAC